MNTFGLLEQNDQKMTKEDARQMVVDYLYDDAVWANEIRPTILDEITIEKEFGWVFFYQSYAYVKTENNPLAGNAPLIIDKEYNILMETGTAEMIEFYIELYEKNRGNIEAFHSSY